jgi:hypothetical protein
MVEDEEVEEIADGRAVYQLQSEVTKQFRAGAAGDEAGAAF